MYNTVMAGASCDICCEVFNKSNHIPVTCECSDCIYTCCKECIREYFLSTTTDPHCMDCKKAWSQNFIIMNLNRSFCEGEYRQHRKQLLLESEISKLPETMDAASKYERISAEKLIQQALKEEKAKIMEQVQDLHNKIYTSERKINNLKYGKNEQSKREFIMACPNNDCRGYLSTQYKCDLCSLYTCPRCIEIVGHNKTDEHVCNEDNVKSAELIKKDTRPCPSCGTRIYKLVGCDQMWCTGCNKGFSWRTGRIIDGVIHNPHYYEWQASQNTVDGTAPRNPQDVLCGGLIHYGILQRNILRKLPDEPGVGYGHSFKGMVSMFHRLISHITNVSLVDAREKVRSLTDYEPFRVQYLVKEITKEQLAQTIFRKDNLRKKYNEMLHIYELLSVVGIEVFNDMSGFTSTGPDFKRDIIRAMKRYHVLREYCNKQMATISVTYNQNVPQIDEHWVIETEKFSLAKAKQIK